MNYPRTFAEGFVKRAVALTGTLKTASKTTLALMIVCQGMLFGAARPVAAQARVARTTRAGQLQQGAGDTRRAFNGQPGAAMRKATVNVKQLAQQLAIAPEQLAPAAPGDLLISEYRLRGPSGNTDEFIEIYNNSDAPFVVNTADGSAGYSLVASDGVVRFTIPNGQMIPARGHYLATGPAYSLGLYPAGNGTTALGDTSYAVEIQDLPSGGVGCFGNFVNGRGIALFNTSTAGNFTLANRIDAVGSVCEPDALYREGAGHPVLNITSSNIEHTWFRNQGVSTNGLVQDTDNNAADFLFADTNGLSAGAPQRLGAPGPENTTSPTLNNNFVLVLPLDPNIENNLPPNRVREQNPTPPIPNASFGTLSFRKRIVNNSGAPITRLRFRIVDMTTFLSPAGTADLRALTSGPVVVTLTGGGMTTVQGTTVETPPNHPNGGGYNSTLSAGTVTFVNPLPAGATLNIQFLLGLQQTGRFRFFVNVEALP